MSRQEIGTVVNQTLAHPRNGTDHPQMLGKHGIGFTAWVLDQFCYLELQFHVLVDIQP